MTTDVKARLVLDDAASATVNLVASGIERVNHHVHEATREMGMMAKQAFAVAAGFQLSGAVDTMKEIASEAMHIAESSQEQQESLAGILTTLDKTGATYEETLEQAVDLHNELQNMGIAAGVSADAVVDAFETIASRSQRPKEEIAGLVEQMSQAGRAVHGGIGAVANAMRELEIGIVRPRNALVQLMIQTKTVQGTSQEVAKGLTKMVQDGKIEEAFKLAEIAIGKMSTKMKDAPLSFTAVKQSIKDIRDNIFQAMGIPVLESLTPVLTKFRSYLLENREAIEHWATTVGERAGVWIGEAAKKIQEGFQYLQSHWKEIMEVIERGAKLLRDTFKWILDHKTELAVALGVRMISPKAMSGGADLAEGIKTIVEIGKKMADMGMAQPVSDLTGISVRDLGDKVPMLSAGLGMSVVALGAFAAALASVTAAAYQAKKLYDETRTYGRDADTRARMEAMERAAKSGNVEEARRLHGAISASGVTDIPTLQAAQWLEEQAAAVAKANADWESQVRSFAATDNADALMQMFDEAKKKGDEGRMKFVTEALAGRDDLDTVFSFLSKGLTDSLQGLITSMKEVDLAAASQLQAVLDVRREGKAAPRITNFNGGQTFNIKQDFRNEDPDRIAMVFRKDILNAAESRRQSRLATPFGL